MTKRLYHFYSYLSLAMFCFVIAAGKSDVSSQLIFVIAGCINSIGAAITFSGY